jgi:hypothetical protein
MLILINVVVVFKVKFRWPSSLGLVRTTVHFCMLHHTLKTGENINIFSKGNRSRLPIKKTPSIPSLISSQRKKKTTTNKIVQVQKNNCSSAWIEPTGR